MKYTIKQYKSLSLNTVANLVYKHLFGESIKTRKPTMKQALKVLETLRQTYCCIDIKSDWTYCWTISMTRGEQRIGDSHEVVAKVDGFESLVESIFRVAFKAELMKGPVGIV